MYICIYICTCICIYVYIYIYLYIYINTPLSGPSLWTGMQPLSGQACSGRTHTHTHIYKYINICRYTCTYIHMNTYIYI